MNDFSWKRNRRKIPRLIQPSRTGEKLPKEYLSLPSPLANIFSWSPGRFVSSGSQGKHDLIFSAGSTCSPCPAGHGGDERHLEPRLQAVRILFSCPSTKPPAAYLRPPPLHVFPFGAARPFAKPVTFLYRLRPRPFRRITCTRETNEPPTHGMGVDAREGAASEYI